LPGCFGLFGSPNGLPQENLHHPSGGANVGHQKPPAMDPNPHSQTPLLTGNHQLLKTMHHPLQAEGGAGGEEGVVAVGLAGKLHQHGIAREFQQISPGFVDNF
jgi:hypothetical protein